MKLLAIIAIAIPVLASFVATAWYISDGWREKEAVWGLIITTILLTMFIWGAHTLYYLSLK